VILNWEKVKNAVSYEIKRDTQKDGSYNWVKTSNTTTYEDWDITPNTTYYYKVVGVNKIGTKGTPSVPHEVFYCLANLEVSTAPIDFGESLVNYDLKLKNTGCLPLHWTIGSSDNWISVNLKEGGLNPRAEQVVRISVKREGDPGEFKGTVLIKPDTGEAITIPVWMKIAEEPRIAIEPSEITFEDVREPRTLTISNVGTGILKWFIQNAQSIPDWLSLDIFQGQTGKEASSRIQLTIKNADKLQPDRTYTAALVVRSNDSTKPEVTVNVTLHVPAKPPELYISDRDKTITLNPGEQSRSVEVQNTGGGVMIWRIQPESTPPWLKVDPQQGETKPGDPGKLTFTVYREKGNQCETLQMTVTVDAGAAGSQSIVVQVPFSGESWEVSPESLTLDEGASKNILIHNTGKEPLRWSAGPHETWIILSNADGSIEPEKTFSLQVSVNHESLTLGSHVGTIPLKTRCGRQTSVTVQTTKVCHITGTTLNSRSGVPVRDVWVSLDGGAQKAYPSGEFRIDRAVAGAFHLQAEKMGYLPATADGEIKEKDSIVTVDMWMRPIPKINPRTITDPAKPFKVASALCFSSDGTRAYVADESGDVSVINALTDSVIDQFTEAGSRLMGIIANPQNDEIYAADADGNKVVIFDARLRKVINSIEVDKYPQQFAISQDGSRLYVSCQNSGTVVLIDTKIRERVDQFFVGREPHGIALSPDERTLYVANSGDNNVSVLSVINGQLLKAIPVASGPQHVGVSGDYVFVSTGFGDQVSVINRISLKLVDNIELGNTIWLDDLAVVEEPEGGDVIYVIDQTNNVLRLIDSKTLKAIDAKVQVGDASVSLAVRPGLDKIYVLNSGSADITVLKF